jgi:sugar lactone lactonase YvrE
MQTIRYLRRRLRFLTTTVGLLILTCGAPLRAWCGSKDLWIGNDNGYGIESFTPGQLKKSGTPTPLQLLTYPDTTGLAFDRSHNLWAVVDNDKVVRFTAAQVKNLKTDPGPTPSLMITRASTFVEIFGCNFDHQGNLWVVDAANNSIDEISKAQLAAGSGDITPAKVISSSDLEFPDFVTFDKAGNAWIDSEDDSKIAEFSASQLSSGGTKSAAVLISDDGSGTSLNAPGEIAFDKKGNLWVPNDGSNTVVEYAKNQLRATSDPTPTVKLSSAVFNGPWGAVFDSSGNLWVKNYIDAMIAKFTPKQLKATGAFPAGMPVSLPTLSSAERRSISSSQACSACGSAASSRLMISRSARRARERAGSLRASSSSFLRAVLITLPCIKSLSFGTP